jgi:peptidoglycan/LPS O-acetylase OafA/YrhL
MLVRRRPRWAAAVVGLLAGLALLLAAVVDGGMTSPTRGDAPDAVAAVPHSELGASAAPAREDHPPWDATVLPPSTIVVLVVAGLALVAPRALPDERRHEEPALLAVRHRGPPVSV